MKIIDFRKWQEEEMIYAKLIHQNMSSAQSSQMAGDVKKLSQRLWRPVASKSR